MTDFPHEPPSVSHLCRECRTLLMRTSEFRHGSLYVSYEHIHHGVHQPAKIGRRHDPDPIPLAGYLP